MNITKLLSLIIILSFFTLAFQTYDQYIQGHSKTHQTTKNMDKMLTGD